MTKPRRWAADSGYLYYKHGRHGDNHRKHRDRPCGNPPAVPANVIMTFQATEARTHLRFTGKVKWDEVTEDTQGHGAKIEVYEVQIRATDVAGVPVEKEDDTDGDGVDDTRIRVARKQPVQRVKLTDATAAASIATFTTRKAHGFAVGDRVKVAEVKPVGYNGNWVIATAPTDTTFTANIGSTPAAGTDFGYVEDRDDKLHIVTRTLPRPRKWYWQARVRAVDTDKCAGNWSAWTAPGLPWTGANPAPPVPTGLDLSFEVDHKERHNRWSAIVAWDEVLNWDVPGGDLEPDMKAYAVQLQKSENGSTKVGKTRTKHKSAKGDETDPDDEVSVTYKAIRKRYYYRARVRSIDRFNRRGAWSSWTAWQQPGTDPNTIPAPTSVTLDVDQHKFSCSWVLPKEVGNIKDASIDHCEVEVRTATGGGGSLVASDYDARGEKKNFRASKPGTSTYYLRVRAVSDSEGTSSWVETNATKTTPSQPAAPSIVIVSKGPKQNRFIAEVTVATVADTDAEMDRYKVQFVEHTGGTPTSSDERSHRVIDATGTSAELKVKFRGLKKGNHVHARSRAIDTQGRRSNWSSWSVATTVSVAEAVATPSLSVSVLKRKLKCTTTDPNDDKVVQWRWVLSGGSSETKITQQPHVTFHVTKGAMGSSHSVQVFARDDMGNESAGSSIFSTSAPDHVNPTADKFGDSDIIDNLDQASGKTWTFNGTLRLTGAGGAFTTGTEANRIELTRQEGQDSLKFVSSGGTGNTVLKAISGGVRFGNTAGGAKLGFFGTSPINQPVGPALIQNPTAAEAKVNTLITNMRDLGLIS